MTSFLGGNRGPAGLALQGNPAGNFKRKIPHGYKGYQIPNYSPDQMQLFQSLFNNVAPGSYLSRLSGGDPSMFSEIEAPAMRQFQELQGQIGSRFSGAIPGFQGAMSARHGSGFQNAANQATSDFAMQLQSQRQALQRQAINDLMGFSHQLLGERPYEQFLVPKQKKESSGYGGLIGAGIGGLGGFAASGGNPAMALAGANLGYGVGSKF